MTDEEVGLARDQPEALQQRIDTLPFSRSLYYAYRKSLQLHEPMNDLERDEILRALAAADGNKKAAAARLRIAQSTLYRKLAQYGY